MLIDYIIYFQVRQWPGNSGDLDFRGVIKGCTAVMVAFAPVPGRLSNTIMDNKDDLDEYLASSEYTSIANVLPFVRLWCIGPLHNL